MCVKAVDVGCVCFGQETCRDFGADAVLVPKQWNSHASFVLSMVGKSPSTRKSIPEQSTKHIYRLRESVFTPPHTVNLLSDFSLNFLILHERQSCSKFLFFAQFSRLYIYYRLHFLSTLAFGISGIRATSTSTSVTSIKSPLQCLLWKPHSSWGSSPRHTEAHIADLEGRHGTLHPPDRSLLQQMPSNRIEEEEEVEVEEEAHEMPY